MGEIRDLNHAVAVELVAQLAQSGLTRLQLAERSGMHVNTISRLLRNLSDIDVNVLARLGGVLRFKPSDLLNLAEHRLLKSDTAAGGPHV
jgi:transcriptional regulator with XRE-family HTH domain